MLSEFSLNLKLGRIKVNLSRDKTSSVSIAFPYSPDLP